MHNEIFNSLYLKARHLLDRLEIAIFQNKKSIQLSYAIDKSYLENDRKDLEFKPIKIGDVWGTEWQTAIFKATIDITSDLNIETLFIHLDLNSEILLLDQDYKPYTGLTSGSVFKALFGRNLIKLPSTWVKNGTLTFYAEASATHIFGIEQDLEPAINAPKKFGNYKGIIIAANILSITESLLQFRNQFSLALNYCENLPKDKNVYFKTLHQLTKTIEQFYKSNQSPEVGLNALKPIFASQANHSELTAYSVGHAHIDTGWLWPVSETVRKCARTFATQLRLMEKYPSYIFGASQPQHYQFVKDHYPDLFAQIKKRVAEGRWECQGAMWVEADSNLISGESMTRQVLYGKIFYKDEFDVDVRNLWLPDVFGYSATLPQILKKSGVDYFLTTKISWNKTNKFPHSTFFWEGIDGSKVLTHFPPENTYNGTMTIDGLKKSNDNFKEKGCLDSFMTLFGVGDGGGGPKEEMIVNGLLLSNLEECPKVTFSPASVFFENANRQTENLATWKGDLYLEFHQGTFTTQAKNKKLNRYLEFELQKLEFLYATNQKLEKYPIKEINKLWKILLINQFHDILPGSSIHKVYEDSAKDYQAMQNTIQKLIAQCENQEASPRMITLTNPFTFAYKGFVHLPESWGHYKVKQLHAEQIKTQFHNNKYYAEVVIPPLGSVFLEAYINTMEALIEKNQNILVLENEFILYEFSKNGTIEKAYDKKLKQELLPEGKIANHFKLFEDYPHVYDAWDIMEGYENCETQGFQTSEHSYCQGVLFDSIQFHLETSKSKMQMTVSLPKNATALQFDIKIDWQEYKKFLRVYFPINIANPEAYCDMAYGYKEIDLRKNTSWDFAKDEMVCHKYITLSNQKQGVAILNDSKYGFKIKADEISLSLLRAPTYPDPEADRGEHEFSYTFYPYQGHFKQSDVFEMAYFLNTQPIQLTGICKPNIPFHIESDSLRLEAFKKCEKENAYLLRLVEMRGCESSAKLHVALGFNCLETTIMEEASLKMSKDALNCLFFKPFEIRCFKICPST